MSAPSSPQAEVGAANASGTTTAGLKGSYVKRGAALTAVPVKVLMMSDLQLLDLHNNAISTVPLGLFADLPHLTTLDLSANRLPALPPDVARLTLLESLVLHHNLFEEVPAAVCLLSAGLTRLDLSSNRLHSLPRSIGALEGLQVLLLSDNLLRSLPSDIGWLPALRTLEFGGNAELRMPPRVLQQGLHAVLSFLQVVGEQHASVETQMAVFAAAQPAPHVLDASRGALRVLQQPSAVLPRDALLVLDVSFQRLPAWPAGLQLPACAVLNASFNLLAHLPEDFGRQAPALQQLFLANNALTSLPSSLAECGQLRSLMASENPFSTVPPVLASCTALAMLTLAACQLAGDCQELGGLSGLRFLDLSFNHVAGLSPQLAGLTNLAALSLAFNPLGPACPGVVGAMTALRELNLDHTGITGVTRALGQLHSLEELQMHNCHLSNELSKLYAKSPLLLVMLHNPTLLSLDLSDCGLDALPAALFLQTQLTALSLARNNLADLPYELGGLRALQKLCLRGNATLQQPWHKIIDARGEMVALALLRPDAARIDVAACGLEELPRQLWELPARCHSVVELDVTNNRLRGLPAELGRLSSITRLVLDSNHLRQLPEVVLRLPRLLVLQASNNLFTFLPELPSGLQALMLSGNQLRQLPDSIGSLQRLRALVLASNRLSRLPGSLAACLSLRLLDCCHNLLFRLPEEFSSLVSLRTLKLTHNRLEQLPPGMAVGLTALTEVQLGGNALRGASSSLAAGSSAAGRAAVVQLLSALAVQGPSAKAAAAPPSGSPLGSALLSHSPASSLGITQQEPPLASRGVLAARHHAATESCCLSAGAASSVPAHDDVPATRVCSTDAPDASVQQQCAASPLAEAAAGGGGGGGGGSSSAPAAPPPSQAPAARNRSHPLLLQASWTPALEPPRGCPGAGPSVQAVLHACVAAPLPAGGGPGSLGGLPRPQVGGLRFKRLLEQQAAALSLVDALLQHCTRDC